MKTIYYYQSFCGLDKLQSHIKDIDTIILSSIHFSKYKNEPYIHLNDYPPTSPIFDNVWIELQKLYNSKVIGFDGDKHRIPGINITLNDGEKFKFGKSIIKIIHIPGHTSGHICFFFEKEKIAFTGDTLFSLGCGRIFEGDHKQMLSSLNKIKQLPKATIIY